MAEPVKMPFRLWDWMGPRNHVLDEGPDAPWEGAILGKWVLIVKYRDFLLWAVQKPWNRSRCCFGCWVRWTKQGATY